MAQYNFWQDQKVCKAAHAIKELCCAVKNMDAEHQRVAFLACLLTLGEEFGWENWYIYGISMRSPAGPRRLGLRRASCASLFRRLSAFFRSASDWDPKAAKYAVLNYGHAGFPKRVERSEGRDTTPHPKRPCFAVCAAVCDFSLKAECVHPFVRESERGPFVREVEKRDEKRFGTALWR